MWHFVGGFGSWLAMVDLGIWRACLVRLVRFYELGSGVVCFAWRVVMGLMGWMRAVTMPCVYAEIDVCGTLIYTCLGVLSVSSTSASSPLGG